MWASAVSSTSVVLSSGDAVWIYSSIRGWLWRQHGAVVTGHRQEIPERQESSSDSIYTEELDFIVIRGKGLISTNQRSNNGNQLNLRITFRF